MSTLQDVAIIVGIAVGIITVVSIAYSIYRKMRETRPKFRLQKFQEAVQKPIKSNWSIRILHPTKLIEKCNVLYDSVPLPWWDPTDRLCYQRSIEVSGGGNVRIPVGIENDNAKVEIRNGKKTLTRVKFKEIAKSAT